MVALTLPLTFLVGCKKSQEEKFVMTEDTIALDGSVEYSAKTYKDAFFSTENYSSEYLQNEFEAIVKEITSKEDQTELVELLKSYSNTQDGDFDYIKTGQYKQECGPLNSPTTNQKMFKHVGEDKWEDITKYYQTKK